MKRIRKITALALTLALTLTGISFTPQMVKADEPTIEDLANAISTEVEGIKNYAYGKKWYKTSNIYIQNEGSPVDGIISADNYFYNRYNEPDQNVKVDLGKIYDADGFDKVAVWFSGQDGTYPVEDGFKVQYTADEVEWHDIATVDQDDFDAQREGQEGPFGVMVDVSDPAYQYVKYFRVVFPAPLANSQYITEIGIFDTDGDVSVADVPDLQDPSWVQVGDPWNQNQEFINEVYGEIEPAEGQEDCTYTIFLNDEIWAEGVSAGEFRLDGVPDDTYSLTVRTNYNGLYSPGRNSTYVSVRDGFGNDRYFDRLGPLDEEYYGTKNYLTRGDLPFCGVNLSASSVAEGDDPDSINNIIDNNTDTLWRSGEGDKQTIDIDMGEAKPVEYVHILWGDDANAKDFNIQFSEDGINYKSHIVMRNAFATQYNDASMKTRKDEFYFYGDSFNDNARYVRIQLLKPNTENGYAINQIAVYGHYNLDYCVDATDYIANHEAPENFYYQDKIFAGWYADSEFNTPFTGTKGYAYAKYIDPDILGTKFQVKDDGTAIRFVSSIDTLEFESVGFKFTGTYGDKTIEEKTRDIYTVYEKISGGGNTYMPNIFSQDSHYFFAYTVRNMDPEISSTNMTWQVTPFFVTHDGTKVYGTPGEYPAGENPEETTGE